MAKLNISQAARATEKSRSTIQRYIKSGKLNVHKNAAGETKVDTAELIRVFGELNKNTIQLLHVSGATKSSTKTQFATPAIEILQKELKTARERERDALKREEWLREQLNAERERSKDLEQRLLPAQGASIAQTNEIIDKIKHFFVRINIKTKQNKE